MGVICCTPGLYQGVYMAFVALLSLFVILFNSSYIRKNSHALLIYVSAFLLLMYIYRLFNISDDAWGRYVMYTIYNLQFLMVAFIPKLERHGGKKIWWCAIMIALLNIIYNIAIRIIFPYLGEKAEHMEKDFLLSLNIGMSTFFTMSLFVFIIFLFVYLNSIEKKIKWIMLLFTIIPTVFIVWYTLKASVVVLYFLSIVLLYFSKGKKKVGYLVRPFVVLSIILLLLTLFTDDIVQLVVSTSPSERLTKRLVMLLDDKSIYASDSSFNARSELWLLSLSTWLDNPSNFIFGVGSHFSSSGGNKVIGQHSDIFDLLAKFGLIGGLLTTVILYMAVKAILKMFEKRCHLQIKMIFLVYIICGFTKEIFSPSIGFALFLLLPLSSFVLRDQNKILRNE